MAPNSNQLPTLVSPKSTILYSLFSSFSQNFNPLVMSLTPIQLVTSLILSMLVPSYFNTTYVLPSTNCLEELNELSISISISIILSSPKSAPKLSHSTKLVVPIE